MRRLNTRGSDYNGESGFSLIDVVVTVAIIVSLSVGGFVSYTGLITSAKRATVDSAADRVYTAARVAENDGDESTNNSSVKAAFEKTTDAIRVDITGSGETLKVVARSAETPNMRTLRGDQTGGIPALIGRTNLVQNPSMGKDILNTGRYYSPTVTRDTLDFKTGNASLKAARKGGNVNQGVTWGTSGYEPKKGDKINAMVRLKVPVGVTATFALKVDAGGGVGRVTHVGTGEWTELSTSYTSTSDWPYMQPIVAVPLSQNMVDGDVMFWVDQVYMEVNSEVPGVMFDGDTPANSVDGYDYEYSWLGTPHSSGSVAKIVNKG